MFLFSVTFLSLGYCWDRISKEKSKIIAGGTRKSLKDGERPAVEKTRLNLGQSFSRLKHNCRIWNGFKTALELVLFLCYIPIFICEIHCKKRFYIKYEFALVAKQSLLVVLHILILHSPKCYITLCIWQTAVLT